MSIRAATPDDIPDLLRMIAALSAHHGDQSRASADSLTRDLFSAPWAHCLIACAPDPVGYAILVPRTVIHAGRRGMELHHLYVEDSHRGTGLGRALIAACETHIRDIGGLAVTVGTDPQNTAAQAFYERRGFERYDPGVRFYKPLDG